MKLTHSQIEELYTFTQQHFVKHFDVQSELLDHLAQDIENQWKTNPNATFEDALKFAFKKFGIFGFEDIVQEKTKALQKKYNLWIWQNLKSFFKLPQIIGTCMAIFLVFKLLIIGKEYPNIELIAKITLIVIILSLLTFFFIIRNKNNKNKSVKRYLMEEIIFNQGFLILVLFNTIFQFIPNLTSQIGYIFTILSSIFIVLMILIIWISFVKIPREAQKYLKITYPFFYQSF